MQSFPANDVESSHYFSKQFEIFVLGLSVVDFNFIETG